ncbi:hypothetical protein ACFL20_00500 [Spirochaetota bacterium]
MKNLLNIIILSALLLTNCSFGEGKCVFYLDGVEKIFDSYGKMVNSITCESRNSNETLTIVIGGDIIEGAQFFDTEFGGNMTIAYSDGDNEYNSSPNGLAYLKIDKISTGGDLIRGHFNGQLKTSSTSSTVEITDGLFVSDR